MLQGVIVIDGNSLYGLIMARLGVFIDRCASSRTSQDLADKLDCDIVQVFDDMKVDNLVEHEDLLLMRTPNEFMSLTRAGPTVLSVVLDLTISNRKKLKSSRLKDKVWAYKLLAVSVYNAMGSRYGIISSQMCAAIVTYLARIYIKKMVTITMLCGHKIIYGDIYSIFPHIGSDTEQECMNGDIKLKMSIVEGMSKTPFAGRGCGHQGELQVDRKLGQEEV